jgi:hypothetical protein
MTEEIDDNVVDISSANKKAEIKLLTSQIKNLLEINANDFAKQYLEKQPEKIEYLIDEDGGLEVAEDDFNDAIDSLLAADSKDEDLNPGELMNIISSAFMVVVIEKITDLVEDQEVENV